MVVHRVGSRLTAVVGLLEPGECPHVATVVLKRIVVGRSLLALVEQVDGLCKDQIAFVATEFSFVAG